MKPLIIAALMLSASSLALAQASPAGLWKTIDDETKIEKSLVRITDQGGAFSGRIEKFLDPKTAADATCEKCSDERKDKPVLGMTIIRGVRLDAKAEHWEGGDILDPNNGKVYRVRLKPIDGGKKLEVRGYIGTPMLGRTQTWIRVE